MGNKVSKFVEKANSLYERASYAYLLNAQLIVTYRDRKSDFEKWINFRPSHVDFYDDYKRLMVRVLVMELCVMFEKNERDRKQQYSFYSITEALKNHAAAGKTLFVYPEQLKAADHDSFLVIKQEVTANMKLDAKSISDLLSKELGAYRKKHEKSLSDLRDIRDTYLAHPDQNPTSKMLKAGPLIEASEWCFSFASLILHLFIQSGGRPFVNSERAGFLEDIRRDHNAVLDDLLL